MAFITGNISPTSASASFSLPPNYSYDAIRYNLIKFALKPNLKIVPPKLKIPTMPSIPAISTSAAISAVAGGIKGGFSVGNIRPSIPVSVPPIPAFPSILVAYIIQIVKKIKLLEFISNLVQGKLPKKPILPSIPVPAIPSINAAAGKAGGFIVGKISSIPALPISLPDLTAFSYQMWLYNTIKMGTKAITGPIPHFSVPAQPPTISVSIG